jgi:hypothetical protein
MKLRILQAAPKALFSVVLVPIENEEPSRVKDRTEAALLILAKSNVLKEPPRRTKARTVRLEPYDPAPPTDKLP